MLLPLLSPSSHRTDLCIKGASLTAAWLHSDPTVTKERRWGSEDTADRRGGNGGTTETEEDREDCS